MSKGVTTPAEAQWTIDLNWLQKNHRSFSTISKSSLCEKCRKKLKADSTEVSPADIIKSVQTCCSKSEGFISPSVPFQASIFRVLLANGNKPLTLVEVGEQLSKRRGADATRTTVEYLTRILANDDFYGIRAK